MNYVLVDRRKGCTVWNHTFSESKWEVWEKSYPGVAAELDWGTKYWKRWRESVLAAKKSGFKIEKCEISLL